MSFRTGIVLSLLQAKVSLWLVEADAVWFSDLASAVIGGSAANGGRFDVLTMSDNPSTKILQGGFQLLRPTSGTIRAWSTLKTTVMGALAAHGVKRCLLNG